MAYPMRWVKLTLPPRPRARWLLITMRLSAISFAGTARTLVAVGTSATRPCSARSGRRPRAAGCAPGSLGLGRCGRRRWGSLLSRLPGRLRGRGVGLRRRCLLAAAGAGGVAGGSPPGPVGGRAAPRPSAGAASGRFRCRCGPGRDGWRERPRYRCRVVPPPACWPHRPVVGEEVVPGRNQHSPGRRGSAGTCPRRSTHWGRSPPVGCPATSVALTRPFVRLFREVVFADLKLQLQGYAVRARR